MKAKSYICRIYKNNKLIRRFDSSFIRRFTNQLRTVGWRNGPLMVYLRITYGRHEDNFGKFVQFDNKGEYTTKKDLWAAFKAFTEDGGEK